MTTRNAALDAVAAPLLTAVAHRVHYEENRLYNADLLEAPYRWERWFNRILFQGSRVRFDLILPGAQPGGAADVLLRLWGVGSSIGAGVPDHVARIYWNRALVDTAGWDLSLHHDSTATGLATGGARHARGRGAFADRPGPFPQRSDRSYLAPGSRSGIRASSSRSTTRSSSPLPIRSTATAIRYQITGVTDTSAVWLLDRTDPESPVRLVGGLVTGGAAPYT